MFPRLILACPLLAALGVSAADAPDASQVVTLNPFEVSSASDRSYGALNSNSITRFNTELNKLPITADIYNQAFMRDVGADSIEGLIETYSAGAGFATSSPGASAATTQPGDRNPSSYVQLRGLPAPAMERDAFMPVGSSVNPGSSGIGVTSNFDTERVEIINGPQAMLYAGGGAGGVINVVSKQARIGGPGFGALDFRIDQYGHRFGLLDLDGGSGNVAVRVDILDQDVGNRRQFIGGPLDGYYAQIGARVFGNTTIRVTGEQTTFDRILSSSPTFVASSTSNDGRNGQTLAYLLASHQIAASATGNSGAGVIDNGALNWNNVNSLEGTGAAEVTVNEFATITAETQWRPWLSTQIAAGYTNSYDDRLTGGNLAAPNLSSNPFPGQWATDATPSDQAELARTKVLRVSALFNNELFGGKVKSQSVIGADYQRTDSAVISYGYYLADANFNPVLTSAGARTGVAAVWWPVNNGPVKYTPLPFPDTPRINVNGNNYVRQLANPVNPALISPLDPEGVTLGGGEYEQVKLMNKGLYGVNYSQWMDGKLDTLAGFRLASSFDDSQSQGASSATNPGASKITQGGSFNFDVGADYEVAKNIRPYFSVSDSFDPPNTELNDPAGATPPIAHAFGEEVGVKVQNTSGTISGSLSAYHVRSKNEQYTITSSLQNDINPSGLNGTYGSPSNWVNVNRKSDGLQLMLTAAPTANWRMRLSASFINGKVESNTSYGQYYNDQFNANAAGQVTYADGTVVYVPAAFNSKQLTVAATTAGAVPLTVAMLSSPSSAYYTSPVAVSGQITASSPGGQVLKNGASAGVGTTGHGSILTGAVGLPISQIQINPGFVPPGTIITSQAGDDTTGYPEYGINYTNVYTFNRSWLRGFKVGGTVALAWKFRSFYDYPNGQSIGAQRALFSFPDMARFDLITGYTHKFKRLTWTSQLNVANLFNHYHVILTPNAVTGWAGPNNATFDLQPRYYQWTNTLAF